MICKTFELGELDHYKYVVVLSFYNDKIVLSKHKNRSTWETQGGHIEHGEMPLEAAKRELYEESGVVKFDMEPLCDYWAGNPETNVGAAGVVFVAKIHEFANIPEASEMAEIKLFASLPDNLTYEAITPVLFEKVGVK